MSGTAAVSGGELPDRSGSTGESTAANGTDDDKVWQTTLASCTIGGARPCDSGSELSSGTGSTCEDKSRDIVYTITDGIANDPGGPIGVKPSGAGKGENTVSTPSNGSANGNISRWRNRNHHRSRFDKGELPARLS